MITVEVDDTAVQARLTEMPSKVRDRLTATVYLLAEKLRSHVVSDKLLGQVLNRRSGRLGQSIQQKVDSSDTGVVGTVYSSGDVPYARIHEYGGVIPSHVIEARNARSLAFIWNGKQAFFKRVTIPDVTMPERSYMRSSLADLKDEIVESMTIAVREGVQE